MVSIAENFSQQADAVSNVEKYLQRKSAVKLDPIAPVTNLPPLDDSLLIGWSKFNLRATQSLPLQKDPVKLLNGTVLSSSAPAPCADYVSPSNQAADECIEQKELYLAANEMKEVLERTRSTMEIEGEAGDIFRDLYSSIQMMMSGLLVLQLQLQQSGSIDSELNGILQSMKSSCTEMLLSIESKQK